MCPNGSRKAAPDRTRFRHDFKTRHVAMALLREN